MPQVWTQPAVTEPNSRGLTSGAGTSHSVREVSPLSPVPLLPHPQTWPSAVSATV